MTQAVPELALGHPDQPLRRARRPRAALRRDTGPPAAAGRGAPSARRGRRRRAPRAPGGQHRWRAGCSRGTGEQPAEQVVRRQVLERFEALADHSHLVGRQVSALTIEARDGLAQAEVAGGPRLRPREVAGEEPVRCPLADPREGRESALDLVVRTAARARAGRGRCARSRSCTRPCGARSRAAVISSASRAASRSRVGNAYACSTRRPKRSIRRFRIANAARKETCWAVIDVTSVSNGSTAIGGRSPRSSSARRASVGSVGCEARRTRRGRTRRRGASARPARSRHRAGRRRHRPGLRDPDLAAADDAMQPSSCQRFARSGPKAR